MSHRKAAAVSMQMKGKRKREAEPKVQAPSSLFDEEEKDQRTKDLEAKEAALAKRLKGAKERAALQKLQQIQKAKEVAAKLNEGASSAAQAQLSTAAPVYPVVPEDVKRKAMERAAELNKQLQARSLGGTVAVGGSLHDADATAAQAVAAAQAEAASRLPPSKFGPPVHPVGVKVEPQAQAAALGVGTVPGGVAVPGTLAGAGRFALPPSLQKRDPSKQALRFDSLGRLVDEKGNLQQNAVDLSQISTLKVNKNKIRQKKLKQFEKKIQKEKEKSEELPQLFDPRVGLGRRQEKRGSRYNFHFVKEGTYVRRAERERAKAVISELEQTEEAIKQAKAKLAGQADPNDPMSQLLAVAGRPALRAKRTRRAVPTVEWWDMPFLPGDLGYDAVPLDTTTDTGADSKAQEQVSTTTSTATTPATDWSKVEFKRVTHYIEHPVPVEPPAAAAPAPAEPMPIILTKRERKKLRHRNRLEKQRDLMDKVRLGLLPPAKPKTKLSNFMRVLGDEAVADPTSIEKAVVKDVNERVKDHMRRNEARKLPAEARKAKNVKKFTEDTSTEAHVLVFRVDNLSHPQKRYKVDVNAQENHLTGVGLLAPSISVVIVEGGPKGINRYRKLMMNRIDWTSNPLPRKEDAVTDGWEETIDNKCVMAWEGIVLKPAFKNFRMHKVTSEAMARQFLKERQVEHYWDLCKNYTEPE